MRLIRVISQYAEQHEAVIVTKDEDLVDRFRRRVGGPVIVWLRIGNAANTALRTFFADLARASRAD